LLLLFATTASAAPSFARAFDPFYVIDPELEVSPDFGVDESVLDDRDLYVRIISPEHAYRIGQAETLELSGEAYDRFGALAETDLRWYSDLDGYLGDGSELVASGLSLGVHRIELRVGGRMASVGVGVFAKSWTILLYMCGDNDLEGFAIGDVNEMEQIGSDANVNVVIGLDRIPGYNSSNGNWTNTRLYYVNKDNNTSIINSQLLANLGEMPMDNGNVLYGFVKWGITNYPAARYAVVIWDHGSGWSEKRAKAIKGACTDMTSGSWTELEIWEVRAALRQALNETGLASVDVLGYDTCLMGMAEVGYETRNEAKYFVASEETEPGDGWEYNRWLTNLIANPAATGSVLGQYMVDAYYGSGYSTLSAADVSKMSTLTSAVNGLAQALIAALPTYKSQITSARTATKKYADTSYLDLHHLCTNLKNQSVPTAVKNAATTLQTAITTYIYKKGGSAANSNGVSIWFPATYNAAMMNSYLNNTDFGAEIDWYDFLDTYF
jgi:hypothetical protein